MIEPSPRSTISGATMAHSQWLDWMLQVMIFSKAVSGMPAEAPEVGVHGGVAHQHIDLPPVLAGAVHQQLQLLLVGDVAGDGHGLAALGLDLLDHRFAGVGLARGDHTLAPFLAISSAMERPMPREEPVMRATLPCREKRSVVMDGSFVPENGGK